MAMGSTAGLGTSGKRKKSLMADINVTPMVDVMLVLLVIFMITAPVIKSIEGLSVDLPQLKGEPAQTIVTEDARTIVIGADGHIARPGPKGADSPYESMSALAEDVKLYREDCEKGKKTPVVVIAGDRDAKWERVMQVWNVIRNSGVSQISFQVESGGGTAP